MVIPANGYFRGMILRELPRSYLIRPSTQARTPSTLHAISRFRKRSASTITTSPHSKRYAPNFYLKTLKLNNAILGFELNNLPVMKGLIDFYSLWQHCLAKDKREKVALILNQSIIDIFSLVFKENSMQTLILQHLKEDQDKREMCTLLFDFLKLTVEHAQKSGRLDNSFLLKLYNQLFNGKRSKL
ncbi:hypothetical protein DOY81_014207 [Sarcophaga bullata]|nr:hypothetical protein DOY81_014207 [Sarcophaga bullata]